MAHGGNRQVGRRCGAAVLIAALLSLFACAALPLQAPVDNTPPSRSAFADASIRHGAELAAIGNCMGCHTRLDAAPFSGGLALATPFGTVYSSNITPAVPEGIGTWDLAAFTRAMRQGVARDGHLLYPAFPYDHFTRSSDEDIAALYAFIMTRTPIAAVPPPNRLHFPLGFRPLVAGWNLLYLDHHPFQPDPAQSATWNRGAYLADALGHCSACHSPRNALGAERNPFSGGLAEGWYAPPLDATSPSPRAWTVEGMTAYLRTGTAPDHATAGGPMQGVAAGLAQASEADVQAIATYIVWLMGPRSPARRARDEAAAQRARSPLSTTTSAAGAIDPDTPDLALGATVYSTACASCHDLGRQLSSKGALRLPLAIAVHDADPASLLRIVREGIVPPDGARGRVMPPFGTSLTDAQLTALAAWLRHAAADAPPWPDLAKAVRDSRPADPKEPS